MWFAGSVQLFKYIQSSKFSRSYKLPFKSTGSNLITSPDIGHLKSCGSYACYYNSIFLNKKEVMLREWSNIEYFKKWTYEYFFISSTSVLGTFKIVWEDEWKLSLLKSLHIILNSSLCLNEVYISLVRSCCFLITCFPLFLFWFVLSLCLLYCLCFMYTPKKTEKLTTAIVDPIII